jgi:uncharacterized protein (TIGR02145 family)
MQKLMYLLAILMLYACGRDTVNPDDYAAEDDIRPNQFTLKSETYMLTSTDKADINGINETGLLVSKNAPWLSEIKVGSVLVNTGSDSGDTMAYFRRVTEILDLPNNTGLRTEDVNLHEAYSRYIIDSRSGEFIYTRTEIFPVTVQCTPAGLSSWIGLTVGATPDINGTVSFDADSTYFTAQYDSSGTIPFKMNMRLKDLRFDLSGTMLFKGDIAAGPALELSPVIPILPIASTGLTLYAQAKAEFKLKVGGQIMSPQLSLVSGPHNFSFTYDESKAEPLSYRINPRIVPQVMQSNQWSASGSGSGEFQAGADVFLGVTGVPDFAKAGFFVFGYAVATAERKGNFTDLQPRVSFDAGAGIGAKVFAELSFLNNETPSGNTGWINLAGKLESPDLKFDMLKWHHGNLNTCTKYGGVSMYIDDFQNTNQLLLDVNCPGCTGDGFFVWVNDIPIANGTSFLYNQSAVIELPPGIELLNSIAIQDELSYGCYLTDHFVDPTLFNANCERFTDARDGSEYCAVQIGNQIWMGENLRYAARGSIGKWYLNKEEADTLLFGRLYTFDEILNEEIPNTSTSDNRIRGLCPQGWHLPTQDEWTTLMNTVGSPTTAGKALKLPSDVIWPGTELPASSQFNAVSSGEYYPWHEGKNSPVSGNKFKQTTYWTSNTGHFPDGTVRPIVVTINRTDQLDIGLAAQTESTGLGGLSSIENIGYSCRCVKN